MKLVFGKTFNIVTIVLYNRKMRNEEHERLVAFSSLGFKFKTFSHP